MKKKSLKRYIEEVMNEEEDDDDATGLICPLWGGPCRNPKVCEKLGHCEDDDLYSYRDRQKEYIDGETK